MIALGMPAAGAFASSNDDWVYIGRGGHGSAHASTLIGDYVVIAEADDRESGSYASVGSGGTEIFRRQRAFSVYQEKGQYDYYKEQVRVRVLIATSDGAFALGGNSSHRRAYTFRSVGKNAMENATLLSATTGASSDATYDLAAYRAPRLPIVVAGSCNGSAGTATIGGGSGTSDTISDSSARVTITWRLDLQQTDSIRYQVSGLSGNRSHAHILGKVTSA
jgi:hypothetical protein